MVVWAISVAGIILLTVLCDVIIPEGQTTKYIKTVTSLIAIVVMISPLPALLNGDLSLEVGGGKGSSIDQNYLEYVFAKQVDAMELRCEEYLADTKGIGGLEIDILHSTENNKISIKKVLVNIENMVIKQPNDNIDIVGEITSTITKLLAVDNSKVVIL